MQMPPYYFAQPFSPPTTMGTLYHEDLDQILEEEYHSAVTMRDSGFPVYAIKAF